MSMLYDKEDKLGSRGSALVAEFYSERFVSPAAIGGHWRMTS